MSRQLRRLTALVALSLAVAALTASPATADPVPGPGEVWPTCGVAPDTDHRYCVRVFFEDGSTPPPVDPDEDGTYVRPRVAFTGAGDVRFRVEEVTVQDRRLTVSRTVDPGTTWRLGLSTGDFRPRATTGTLDHVFVGLGRDDDFATWVATVDFTAPRVAWRDGRCRVDGCGTAGSRADREYAGYAAGRLTDRTGAVGYISVSGAQVVRARSHDHALTVRLANPRLRQSGTRATTAYLTSLPDPMIRRVFGAEAARFAVRRIGSDERVDFVTSDQPGGIRIRIRDIAFSRDGTAAYRITAR